MTLTQSDVTSLLDAIRAGGDIDIIRKGVELVLQALIEAEATEVIGAGHYQRSDTRTTQRNGSRERLLTTTAGDVELRIPKLRRGSFFPAVLERRRRIDRALFAGSWRPTCTASPPARSTALVAALGAASGISKSEVSRVCAGRPRRRDGCFPHLPLGTCRVPLPVRRRHIPEGRVGGPGRLPGGRGGYGRGHDRRAGGVGLRRG